MNPLTSAVAFGMPPNALSTMNAAQLRQLQQQMQSNPQARMLLELLKAAAAKK